MKDHDMNSMTQAIFLSVAIAVCSLSCFGCGSEGSTVIQPSSAEPTSEESAEYEKEMEEMADQR